MTIEDEPVCDDCAARSLAEAHPSSEYWWALMDPGARVDLFSAEPLYRAARVLLSEHVSEEDRIIPTLAFAAEMGSRQEPLAAITERLFRSQESPALQERESAEFSRDLPNLRPVRVVDGVLILEWNPISVKIIYSELERITKSGIAKPRTIIIDAYPLKRMPASGYVEALYEKVLSKAGVPCEEQRTGSMRFDWGHGRLSITVSPSFGGLDNPKFVHPGWVGRYYEMLLGKPEGRGFAQYLQQGRRGPAQTPETLIPACVAACLKRNGKIDSRQRIHALLNENVLCEIGKVLPEIGVSTSEVNQLWRDVERADYRMRVARINLGTPMLIP